MKTKLALALFCVAALSATQKTFAQNSLGKANDVGRICLNSMIASNSSVPQGAQKILLNKLNQIASRNGVGGSSLTPRFVITANVVKTAKEVVPSAPPMVALELETTLYIGDALNGTLYSSHSYGTRKCVGETEDKAYMSGLRNLPVESTAIREFVSNGKNKIVEYYNSQIDFLLSQAESLSNQNRYDEAIALLMEVPEVCKDAYLRAMGKASVIFQKKIDDEGAALLMQANASWKTNRTIEGANEAATYLGQISPAAACASEANALADSIAKYLKELDDREWKFKMKVFDTEVKLEEKRIDASVKRAELDDERERYAIDAMKDIAISVSGNLSNLQTLVLPWW